MLPAVLRSTRIRFLDLSRRRPAKIVTRSKLQGVALTDSFKIEFQAEARHLAAGVLASRRALRTTKSVKRFNANTNVLNRQPHSNHVSRGNNCPLDILINGVVGFRVRIPPMESPHKAQRRPKNLFFLFAF